MAGWILEPDCWPSGQHPERVDLGLRQWQDAAARLENAGDRLFAREFPGTATGLALFECIFAASPFLGQCMVREQPYLRQVWENGPGSAASSQIQRLRQLSPGCERPAASRTLRVTRRRVALTIGLGDISDHWGLEEVTGLQTDLAEASCAAAFRILLAKLGRTGALALPDLEDPEAGSGLIALGMGKLGGRELNFSSDIDLILLYDPEAVPARRPYEVPFHFMKLAQSFIGLLSEPTVDGMAFRVDLRLRPDPVSTPLVMSTKSALEYYSRRGQTWERAALIKARPIAADLKAGEAFLAGLEPFVWRSHLDFATVQELHDIKRRIDAQHRGGDIGARGQNIKLGRGGIREIEFFAQTHQLVWGGTDPALRTIATCDSLRALTAAGHLPQAATDALVDSYRYLRRVEHRIQMVADAQTHSLPSDPAEFETLARFLGHRDGRTFSEELTGKLRQVERQYESFFELPREIAQAGESSVLARASQAEAAERLARMGFTRPGHAAATVEKWRAGDFPAGSDPKGLTLLRSLIPSLVIAACGTQGPDLALNRLDGLMQGLVNGRRAFTLLQANLHVIESVVEILVAAPAVGAILAKSPALLEELLDPAMDAWVPSRAGFDREIAEALGGSDPQEETAERLGKWADRTRLRLAVQLLYRSLDPRESTRLVNDMADCLLAVLLRTVDEGLTRRFGAVSGGGSAIVVLGRAAERELAVGDELRVLLVFDTVSERVTAGTSPVPAQEYYTELANGIHAGLMRLASGPGLFASPSSLNAVRVHRMAASDSQRAVPAPGSGLGRVVACAGRSPLEVGCAYYAPAMKSAHRRARPAHHGLRQIDSHTVDLRQIELAAEVLLEACDGQGSNPPLASAGDVLADIRDRGGVASGDARILLAAWKVATQLRGVERLLGRTVGSEGAPNSVLSLIAGAVGSESTEDVGKLATDIVTQGRAVAKRLLGGPSPA